MHTPKTTIKRATWSSCEIIKIRLWSQVTWVEISGLPPTGCCDFGKYFGLPMH